VVDILVDVDTGIDDALMLLYLSGSPEANIVAAGSVHGNVPAPTGARNTRYVFDLVGLDRVPVAVGCHRPMAQPLMTAEWVHGQDGLGNINAPPPRNPLSEETAVEQMVRLARERPGQLTIVAVGPLTNLGTALLVEPRLPELIRQVVVMGGAIAAPGNSSPVAEANIWHDPEAADLVFGAAWDVVLAPLDVTMVAILKGKNLDRIESADSERGRFATAILQHYTSFYGAALGVRGSALHDPLAGALALDPSICDYLDKPIHVAMRGEETRGMTVVDRRHREHADESARPPVHIAMQVDSDRFLEMFVQRVLGEAKG
jgi:purine nucleosidase